MWGVLEVMKVSHCRVCGGSGDVGSLVCEVSGVLMHLDSSVMSLMYLSDLRRGSSVAEGH